MDAFKNPNNPKDKRDPESQKEVHRPEFILMDGHAETMEGTHFEEVSPNEGYESIQNLTHIKYSWIVRVTALSLCLFVSIVAIPILSMLLIVGAAATILLFQSEKLNIIFQTLWSYFKKICIMILGLAVAFFSPALGFGIILLGFMLRGEKMQDAFLSRFIRMP